MIDLSAIDADVFTSGDQAFALVGAFTGTAGQMTITSITNGVLVSIDTNGSGTANSEIEVYGQLDLDETDFIL